MFKFKPTNQTYSDPVAATFIPGIPFGREKSRGDICLLHEGFQSSKIFLNSIVLREAILNSKEYLEEALNILIVDKESSNKKVAKMEIVESDILESTMPESGKNLILESDDIKDSEIIAEEETGTEEITEENTADTVEITADSVEKPEEETVLEEEVPVKETKKKTAKK